MGKVAPELSRAAPLRAYFRRAGGRDAKPGRRLSIRPAGFCSEAAGGARSGGRCARLRWSPARSLAPQVDTMRVGSGAFAASCVAIEVLGVAIFLRGFFPAPVRSSSRTEHRAEAPAPEPAAGTDPPASGPAPRPCFPLSAAFHGGLLFRCDSQAEKPLLPSWCLFLCPTTLAPTAIDPTSDHHRQLLVPRLHRPLPIQGPLPLSRIGLWVTPNSGPPFSSIGHNR